MLVFWGGCLFCSAFWRLAVEWNFCAVGLDTWVCVFATYSDRPKHRWCFSCGKKCHGLVGSLVLCCFVVWVSGPCFSSVCAVGLQLLLNKRDFLNVFSCTFLVKVARTCRTLGRTLTPFHPYVLYYHDFALCNVHFFSKSGKEHAFPLI